MLSYLFLCELEYVCSCFIEKFVIYDYQGGQSLNFVCMYVFIWLEYLGDISLKSLKALPLFLFCGII